MSKIGFQYTNVYLVQVDKDRKFVLADNKTDAISEVGALDKELTINHPLEMSTLSGDSYRVVDVRRPVWLTSKNSDLYTIFFKQGIQYLDLHLTVVDSQRRYYLSTNRNLAIKALGEMDLEERFPVNFDPSNLSPSYEVVDLRLRPWMLKTTPVTTTTEAPTTTEEPTTTETPTTTEDPTTEEPTTTEVTTTEPPSTTEEPVSENDLAGALNVESETMETGVVSLVNDSDKEEPKSAPKKPGRKKAE